MKTVGEMLRWRTRLHPDAVALRHGDRASTYRELDRAANRVANALISAGLSPGDRVCVLDKGHDEFIETLFGIAKAGGVYTPVNWRLAPPEIAYVINDSMAPVVFVGDAFADAVASVEGELERVKTIVRWGEGPAAWPTYRAFCGGAAETDPRRDSADGDDGLAALHQRHDGSSQGHRAHPLESRRGGRRGGPGLRRGHARRRRAHLHAALPHRWLRLRAGDVLRRRRARGDPRGESAGDPRPDRALPHQPRVLRARPDQLPAPAAALRGDRLLLPEVHPLRGLAHPAKSCSRRPSRPSSAASSRRTGSRRRPAAACCCPRRTTSPAAGGCGPVGCRTSAPRSASSTPGRQRLPAGRGGRDLDSRRHGDEGLLEPARRDRRGAPRRLVPLRRRAATSTRTAISTSTTA